MVRVPRHRRATRSLWIPIASGALIVVAIWVIGAMSARLGTGESPGLSPTATHESSDDLLTRARRAFAAIEIDATCLTSVAEVRAVLARSEVRDPELASDPRLAELLDQSAEFLCGRYGPSANADQYIRWRRDQGYRWTDRDDLEINWTVHEAWPLIVTDGTPFPGYDHPDRVFAGLFGPVLDLGTGRNRPIGISADSAGLIVDRDYPTKSNPDLDLISGTFDEGLWHGRSVGTLCAFWQPPRAFDRALVIDGSVEVVRIGMIVEFADGSRRPMIQKWLWDPKADRWFLYALNEQHDEGKGAAGYY